MHLRAGLLAVVVLASAVSISRLDWKEFLCFFYPVRLVQQAPSYPLQMFCMLLHFEPLGLQEWLTFDHYSAGSLEMLRYRPVHRI